MSESVKISQKTYEESIKEFPNPVYKYRKWSDKFHRAILTEQVVFMARPSSFDDPLDCKLKKRYDLLTNQQIYDKYYSFSKKDNPSWTEQQHIEFATYWFHRSPMRDGEQIKKINSEFERKFDERFGVLSLTANNSNLIMWEKYSEQHTGFCIGFDTSIMFRYLGGGGKVKYYDTLPDIMPLATVEEEHCLIVFSKENKWEYEDEYRTHMFYNAPATVIERTIKLPKECYKVVIFGAEMIQENRKQIISICVNEGLKVDFLAATIKNNTNSVNFEKLMLGT